MADPIPAEADDSDINWLISNVVQEPPEQGHLDDQNLEVMTSESEDSNKSSALSSPSSSNAPAIPSHPGCRGGHQMVINSDNQVSELIFGAFGDFLTQSGTLGVFCHFCYSKSSWL